MAAKAYLVILLMSVFIIYFNHAFFSITSLLLVILATVILIYLFFNRVKEPKITANSLIITVLVVYLLYLYTGAGIYQTVFIPSIIIGILNVVFFPILLNFVLTANDKFKIRRYFFIFLVFAGITRILMLYSSPAPVIDVFTILKEAPLKLIKGINPYNTVYSQVYKGNVTDYFPYWPYSFLLELPAVLIFKDPRFLLVICDLLAACLIYISGNKSFAAVLFSLIYLFRPNSLFIIEQSWLTPLLSLLSMSVFALLLRTKEKSAGLIGAILAGIQPLYSVLFLLTFNLCKNKMAYLKYFIIFLFTPVIVFLIWQPQQFIDRTIGVYFKPLSEIPTIPVHISLNINSAYFFMTQKDLPAALSMLPVFAVIFCLLFYDYRNPVKNFRKNLLNRLHLTVIFFYLFFLFFRQSFINYYYYAGSLLIFWVALKMKFTEK